MAKIYLEMLEDLENKLNTIDHQTTNILEKSERSFTVCNKAYNNLKQHIYSNDFKDEADEIHFFKVIKPLFVSKLNFHILVFNIETKKPNSSLNDKIKYYNSELKKLKKFYDYNSSFYQYYRANCTHLDNLYFLRGQQDIKLKLDRNFSEADPKFSTSHGHIVDNILTNDLLSEYLENEIAKLESREAYINTSISTNLYKLKWTDPKVYLVELIYALHAVGVFNKGNAGLNEIAAFFQSSFEIDLGQYNRVFTEIRQRKNGKTKFLETLINMLNKRMDDADS